ncbi:MAG: CDP-alcohol phosphatidyltransferase family protein [archaeon]|nr:CDP-alcohol phosphatidyltransferase family protein [archaeon]
MERRTDSTLNTASILKLIKLPDLLSVLNALLGFSAILLVLGGISVTERAIKNALVLILLAAVVDGLDGMVARNVECSPLGVYLDSLADMLSFGVAPAIIVYVLIKDYLGVSSPHVDVVLAFCGAYVISGMLRLARFNANLFLGRKALPKERKNDFIGFPITGSATFLASFMLLAIELEFPPYSSAFLLVGLMGILCFLMTSRIRYRSIRDKRLVIPVGIVFFTFFFFSILSLQFIYLALAVVALTTVYMCSPLLYLDKRT